MKKQIKENEASLNATVDKVNSVTYLVQNLTRDNVDRLKDKILTGLTEINSLVTEEDTIEEDVKVTLDQAVDKPDDIKKLQDKDIDIKLTDEDGEGLFENNLNKNKMTRSQKIKQVRRLVESIQKQTGKKVVFAENVKTAKEAKINRIKRLIEKIESETGKKVSFKPKTETKYSTVGASTGKQVIEKWLTKTPAKGAVKGSGDNTAEGLIKTLKSSGFELVKSNKVEGKKK